MSDYEYTEQQLEAIRASVCVYIGAGVEWAELAERGATDEMIVQLAARQYGLGGGSGGPGRLFTEHKGSPTIQLTIKSSPTAPPQLQLKGAGLVQAIRLAWHIPEMPNEYQLSLF